MDVSKFNNERLITMINQSFNFDKELVSDLSNEIIKRGLLSQFEIDKLLTKAEIVKKQRKEEKKIEVEKSRKKQIRANRLFNISLLVSLIASVVIFIYTGWIFVLFLSPIFFGGSKYYRRGRYN